MTEKHTIENKLKLCKRCILPETFPGIKFTEEGICNHCVREKNLKVDSTEKKSEYRRKLDDLLQDIKGQAPAYDAIMAYSGGKDSSYTIKLLKERYDLRILAYSFDNHFLSPLAKENIARMFYCFYQVNASVFIPTRKFPVSDFYATVAIESFLGIYFSFM